MSRVVFRDGDGKSALAEDDIRGIGIQWLYVHTYHPERITNAYECFFADYEFVDATCVSKHPLITDLKQAHAQEKLGHRHVARHILTRAISAINDHSSGEINVQDNEGNTALHYAVMYSIISKELKPASTWSAWSDDLPSQWAHLGGVLLSLEGCTSLDVGSDHTKSATFSRRCLRLDIKNKTGKTVRDLASGYPEIIRAIDAAAQR